MQRLIRIVLVDDHLLYRQSFSEFLQRFGFEVIGSYPNNAEIIETLIPDCLPDIAIIAYKTSHPESINTARWLKRYYPQIKILLHPLYNNKLPFQTFKTIGIEGVLLKSEANVKKIIIALESLYVGETFYPDRYEQMK